MTLERAREKQKSQGLDIKKVGENDMRVVEKRAMQATHKSFRHRSMYKKGKNMKKQRSSNFELLRIVAMFMIVLYHIYIHCISGQLIGGETGLFATPQFSKKLIILALVAPMGMIGNHIFIMISGYFMANKDTEDIHLEKIAKKLVIQQAIAAIVLVISSVFAYRILRSNGIPVRLISGKYFNSMSWYIGYYFLIILFGKLFINKFLNSLDQSQYLCFLIVLFTCTQLSWIVNTVISISDGLGRILVGIFVYSLGGYLQKYGNSIKVKTKTLLGILLLVNFWFAVTYYTDTTDNALIGINTQTIPSYELYHVLPLVTAGILFELFRRLPAFYDKYINYVGGATLMMYLLHDNELFYSLWNSQDWISLLYYSPIKFMGKYIMWGIGAILIGVVIYACCSKIINGTYSKPFDKTNR